MLFLAALPALDGGLNGSLPEILIAALAFLACLPAALLRPAPTGFDLRFFSSRACRAASCAFFSERR